MDANALELSMNEEFALHATALSLKQLNRDELEEAFMDTLHQKIMDKQMFFSIMKEHGIDAEIKFNYSTESQLS